MADNTSDYYDEVDESAYEKSAENRSEVDPTAHDTWQSTTISTDGTGPGVDDVAPVFAQARAEALAHPLTADDDDDRLEGEQAQSAEDAAQRAEDIRSSNGYVAATGEDAGIYDKDDERYTDPSAPLNAAGGNTVTDDDAAFQEQSGQTAPASPQGEGEAYPSSDPENSEANPQPSTPDAPTSNEGDTTHDDLVSDTAGEQGGLDASSAAGATPKTSRKSSSK
jgi:hypothetical protein